MQFFPGIKLQNSWNFLNDMSVFYANEMNCAGPCRQHWLPEKKSHYYSAETFLGLEIEFKHVINNLTNCAYVMKQIKTLDTVALEHSGWRIYPYTRNMVHPDSTGPQAPVLGTLTDLVQFISSSGCSFVSLIIKV